MEYIPKRVFFEKKALDYQLGEDMYKLFQDMNVEIGILKNNRVSNIPSRTPLQAYVEGKNTLVVRVRKKQEFQTCKPSAHYQLPIFSGCAGKCQYCYLNTRFGKKPYITAYANIDEILNQAQEYINERKPETTIFEAAATSDPIPVEKYTGSLARTIEFIGKQDYAKLRFVTKFSQIDSLLNLKHNNNTAIRFSINSQSIIKEYEHGVSSLSDRIKASKKIIKAGYKLGFIIGPVILYDNWQNEYKDLLKELKRELAQESDKNISFEIISHRFTSTAKNKILELFPDTTLPMSEKDRVFKYGQFGYGKYVYNKNALNSIKELFKQEIVKMFKNSDINYII
ncbi:spore photoproduct lyase [Brassicibacter mesophilus]|uniref:spore photoproduct lyase n=1 Tax=Brassicibacter mesophilus TaxID=745119 RepID=UPI003D1C398B